MQAQGVITGRHIELLHETHLPDGMSVIVDIRPVSISLEEKRRMIDELCGSWAEDSSLSQIFSEIEKHRCDSGSREVNFDAAS